MINDSQTTEQASTTNVMAARISKLPAFWAHDPTLWFAQIEALFSINGVTRDATKFDYILAHSSSELFPYVSIVLKEELGADETKYKKFKERVTQGFATSE